jgi:hypothetical protein
MQYGVFPERLKFSIIKPIYKKGYKSLPSNYRPISLLTSFSKIVEKIMYNRLVSHLKKHAILNPNQYGFQEKISTDNAIYSLLNTVLTALNNKSKAKGIFYDIEKAFDCVNHDILLHKLEIYGITGKIRKLYAQYIKDRYQRVSLKDNVTHRNIESNWSKVMNGVPQGSVLGPLLFLLYINDLPVVTEDSAKPILFADDTSLMVTDKSSVRLDTKLRANITIIDKWFKSNLLTINFSKTYSMQFKTKNTDTNKTLISCNSNEIEEVHHLKFLGLEIDNVLSWSMHIETINTKLTRISYMMRSIKPYMSLPSLIMIYYSLFHSTLSYSIIFWGQAPNTMRLFILQKRVLRIMTGKDNRHSCRNLFKQLGILPLKSLYIFSILQFVSKNRKLFTTNYDTHHLQTRQSNNLFPPNLHIILVSKGCILHRYQTI